MSLRLDENAPEKTSEPSFDPAAALRGMNVHLLPAEDVYTRYVFYG